MLIPLAECALLLDAGDDRIFESERVAVNLDVDGAAALCDIVSHFGFLRLPTERLSLHLHPYLIAIF